MEAGATEAEGEEPGAVVEAGDELPGQNVVVVVRVSVVTFPTGQFVTVGAQDVMV